MKAIELINVSKVIKEKCILDNIVLSLDAGHIYGFWGRNGSGKTMLFKAICGLIHPTKGQIKLFGKVLGDKISFPESVGIIIENIGFWDEYTGFMCLKLLASIKNQIKDDEIEYAIERVGLDPKEKKLYRHYSLGMKQRLGIAQAIMEKPQLIILDEPTNALDEEGINLIRQILIEEKKRGATILIASHNREDINLLCDKVYKMDCGRISEIKDIGV